MMKLKIKMDVIKTMLIQKPLVFANNISLLMMPNMKERYTQIRVYSLKLFFPSLDGPK